MISARASSCLPLPRSSRFRLNGRPTADPAQPNVSVVPVSQDLAPSLNLHHLLLFLLQSGLHVWSEGKLLKPPATKKPPAGSDCASLESQRASPVFLETQTYRLGVCVCLCFFSLGGSLTVIDGSSCLFMSARPRPSAESAEHKPAAVFLLREQLSVCSENPACCYLL